MGVLDWTLVERANMIASLMMYARPELDAAHKRYWMLIRDELAAVGIESPLELSQNASAFVVWEDPDLVLSQTCGMPYRLRLKDKVTLVGTPDYGLPDCAAGYYRSPFVVRANDPRTDLRDFKDATFAFNQPHSQSGYAAPYAHARGKGVWFDELIQTGSHNISAACVADGRAEIAALDGMTWRLIMQYEPFAKQLRVLEWTAPTPGLPLITSSRNDPDKVFTAVQNAITRMDPADKAALHLKSLVKISKADYLAVPNPPEIKS